MRGVGRTMWGLHWAAAVAAPIWWIIGSTITGGGWGTLGVELLSPVVLLLGLVCPIIGVASRTLRTARAVPSGYAIATFALWVPMFLFPLTIRSQSDVTTGGSALMGIGVPGGVNDVLSPILLLVSFLAWVVALVMMLVGMSSTRGPVGPVPPVPTPPVGQV
jgi:hypothetical protein